MSAVSGSNVDNMETCPLPSEAWLDSLKLFGCRMHLVQDVDALPPGVEAVHPEPMEDRRQAKKVTDGVGVWKVEGEKIKRRVHDWRPFEIGLITLVAESDYISC